jgi:thiosulfate/3-mercaptopyruvate sulfurtransferase
VDPIISPQTLRALSGPELVLLDCRTGPRARADYEAGHLPSALFVDLETDLSRPTSTPERGGRHPLPDASVFAERLGAWGITPTTHVVAYDDQGGANAAARLWWMLRALGHTRVQVLDGGLQAALAEGFALSTEPARPQPQAPYPTQGFAAPLADIEQVDRARGEVGARVLDVRASPRFRGENEPLDPVAGHIPGAQNLPLSENLRDGRFKPPEELRKLYQTWLGEVAPERLIVHCGSGVTACHTLLALERAGLPGAKLYVGSYSEWCRNPERPIARGI